MKNYKKKEMNVIVTYNTEPNDFLEEFKKMLKQIETNKLLKSN